MSELAELSAKEDSLKKRYFFKLFANIFGLLISLVSQAVIPRGLGPKAYGDFSFLTSFFNEVIGFLDMGTSIGFFTKLSRRPGEFGLVSFYFYFSIATSCLMILFAFLAQVSGAGGYLWPGQQSGYIYLAVLWGILTWFSQVFNKMADAYGVTVSAELARLFQKGVGMILILVLFLTGHLTLGTYFIYNYILLFMLIGVFAFVIERDGHSFKRSWRLSRSTIVEYVREFYGFSHPLLTYALIGLFVGVFDRWLLQLYGGSIQQGFYGLSYQIGTICFLFTSAMAPLLMREFSIAFGNRDIKAMAQLFRRYIPLLYAVAAFFACFVAVQADNVVGIMGGENYGAAVIAVMIMAFYPIHQTYGQLSGSIFYATGQTALYRNIGVSFMLLGLPITYLMIAPSNRMGLALGATGLAVKMVLQQFVAVNVQLYYNSKFLHLKFHRYFGHQILCIGAFSALALVSRFIVGLAHDFSTKPLPSFIVAGSIYLMLVGVVGYCLPVLFGISKSDISSIKEVCIKRVTAYLKGKTC